MILVIIAGGSGTRLWPLSTSTKPKHLLKLLGERSLLQTTFDRVKSLTSDIYILTERSHATLAKAQLPELAARQFIIEPARRGTASCILLALNSIRKRHQSDETVVFIHADHHIPDVESFNLALTTAVIASAAKRQIALVGVEPYYAATGFGYIKKGKLLTLKSSLPVYKVTNFKEKPSSTIAQRYLTSGKYLWNMGLFAAPIEVFEDNIRKFAPQLYRHYQKLAKADNIANVYRAFPAAAIDTALIEKTPNVIVIPGTFQWADVGSFYDLHMASERDSASNVKIGSVELADTHHSYVRNELTKPLLVIGLDHIVVVATADGLLVCHRDQAQKVGETYQAYDEKTA